MPTRRHVLTATGIGIVGGMSGCLDAIPFLGDDPIEFEATPASVSESALQDTGYEEQTREEVVVERTFEAGGQTQDVVVTNWLARYDKAVDFGTLGLPIDERFQAAIFTALTTPSVSVLDRSFNPVADMTAAELAEMVQDRYEGLDGLSQVGETEATVAGRSTTVGEFVGDAELVAAGASVELALHVAEAVESGADLIVAIGGYPRVLQNRERSNVFALMEAIEHDG